MSDEARPEDQSERTARGLGFLVDRITPWLVDVGTWVFGGLMAVNLVVVSALITVGPVDAAIRVSTGALAAALPLNVAGLVLLKLIKDVTDVRLDDLTLKSFQHAGFPEIEAYFPPLQERASRRARRARIALAFASAIAASSVALTVTGTAAALWHVGRGMAFVLVSSVILSALLVTIAIAISMPPESDAEKALKARISARRP
jgi:hypothetical protein